MTPKAEHLGAGIYHHHIDEDELNALDKLFIGEKKIAPEQNSSVKGA